MTDINFNNTITGGSVTIEDGKKASEEYAPGRKVAVTLNFSTPEGTDGIALLDYVTAVANGRVLSSVHGKAPPAAPAPAQAAAPAEATKTPAAAKKAAAAAAKPAEKTKADLAKEAGLPATDTQHKGKTPALVDELEEEEEEEEEAAPAAEPDDELADLLGDAAPTPITDKDLGAAANKWVAEQREKLKDKYVPTVIREFIAKYAGEAGKPMSAIPQAKRAEFVEKLKTLKGTK